MTGKHARSVPNGCQRSFCTYEGLTLRTPSNLESRRPTSNVAHMLIVRAGTGIRIEKVASPRYQECCPVFRKLTGDGSQRGSAGLVWF